MLLRAAWVAPIAGPPLRGGGVRIAGGRIAAVAPAEELPADGEPVTDLGDVLLLPGLVNPHTHLELTCYAGQIAPAGFWDWLPQLVRLRAAPGQWEREQRGVAVGAWQSLRAGVTCVGDISRRNLAWSVLRGIPIRKVCFVELLSLADHPPRDLAELRAAAAQVEEDPLLTVGITPHTPFTVPVDQVRGALALAAELGRPWCTHWAETREERAFLHGAGEIPGFLAALLEQCGVRSPRSHPLDVLEQCTWGAGPGALAHCNYVEPGDAERLAAAGHTVMYCPRAHRFFGHAPHPYRELKRAGVPVALATDSAASNQDLALLRELQFVRQFLPDPPPPAALLEMVTRTAARALGLEQRVGTLEPGKEADLAAFPCRPDAPDPIAELIDAAPPPVGVWVAGQRVI